MLEEFKKYSDEELIKAKYSPNRQDFCSDMKKLYESFGFRDKEPLYMIKSNWSLIVKDSEISKLATPVLCQDKTLSIKISSSSVRAAFLLKQNDILLNISTLFPELSIEKLKIVSK